MFLILSQMLQKRGIAKRWISYSEKVLTCVGKKNQRDANNFNGVWTKWMNEWMNEMV